MKIKSHYLKMLIIGIFCLAFPLPIPDYFKYTIHLTGIYMIVAVGLNLLLGYTGQISIGHAAFMCIGAYTSALLVMNLGWDFWFAVPIAGVFTALVGILLGLPAIRLHGHYLAIATLGFGVAVTQIMSTMELTGGYSGLLPPAPTFPPLVGGEVWSDLGRYYIVLFFVVVTFILASNIIKSRTGRAFMAIRDSEIAAMAMGVNIAKYKLISFALSAFFTGVAGGLYAHFVGIITPDSFHLGMSLNFFAMIVIGGMGNLRGAIYGALFMTLVPEFLSEFEQLTPILMGSTIILVTLFLPGGIVTLENKLLSLIRKVTTRKSEGSSLKTG